MMTKTFAVGSEAFRAYKEAAAKEASSGGWMTSKFESLVITPTINLIAQEIKAIQALVKENREEKNSYLYATLAMAAILPTIILLLVVILFINSRIVRKMRSGLEEANDSITNMQGALIRNQAQAPPRPGGVAPPDVVQPAPINM